MKRDKSKIRYFYYISKPKVRMLLSQLTQKSRISALSSKLSFGGVGLGLEYKFLEDDNQDNVNEILELIKKMKRKKMFEELQSDTQISTSNFYLDNDAWFHSLYSVAEVPNLKRRGLSERNHLVIYALWRHERRKIFLLFGSPANVLGEKIIQESTYTQVNVSSNTIIQSMVETPSLVENDVLPKFSSWKLNLEHRLFYGNYVQGITDEMLIKALDYCEAADPLGNYFVDTKTDKTEYEFIFNNKITEYEEVRLSPKSRPREGENKMIKWLVNN